MIRYSIHDIEKITGIKAHTIRIWEKRYGIVFPERTQTNIRYYCDEELKKIMNISTLNNNGYKISQIAIMSAEEINEKIIEISASSSDYEIQINNLVVAMLELEEEKFEKTLSTGLIKLGFEKTFTHIIYPFLDKLGILWQIGTINPAQEHFISNLIRQKLILAIDGQNQTTDKNTSSFLLFLPEGELHEIGLLFCSYLLKKSGQRVVYLGQSVPLKDLVEIIKITHIDYLLTFFVKATPLADIKSYIKRLAESIPDKTIYITGQQLKNQNLDLPSNFKQLYDIESLKALLKD
ncbi:MAG: MerR family transcriptional regulator [Bacteroidales bacterium]|nr:MerR family transcriptional regulator [Bacteroidales bacterium]